MTFRCQYESAFHWWGPVPVPATPLTLPDLIRNGTLEFEVAAILCAALAQRRSLSVIGGPSGLGKSTLLHALVPWLPSGTRRVYLRGCYETFAFQNDPQFPATSTALLVNEISPHVPIYLWGPAVKRTLEAVEARYQLLATAHGRGVVEFVASLTASPLRLPARLLASLDLVALLEPAQGESGRQVTQLWQLSLGERDGVALDQVNATNLPSGVTPDVLALTRASLSAAIARTSESTNSADTA